MITWSEKDIEDYVCENVNELFGNEFHFLGRQIKIGLGIIDVLLFCEADYSLYVVEIKKDVIEDHALAQIMRYMTGVRDYYLLDDRFVDEIYEVKGILLGTDIRGETTSALRFVDDHIKFHKFDVSLTIEASEITYERNEDLDSYKPKEFNDFVFDSISAIFKEPRVKEGESDG